MLQSEVCGLIETRGWGWLTRSAKLSPMVESRRNHLITRLPMNEKQIESAGPNHLGFCCFGLSLTMPDRNALPESVSMTRQSSHQLPTVQQE